MFTIFSCSIYGTVTSPNGAPSFHLHQICGGVIYTPTKILIFYVCCIEMVKNFYRNAKVKI